MRLTVDANILFSCLLKKGITRRIWFKGPVELYSPEFILAEFAKYRGELLDKFGGSEEDFDLILQKTLRYITIVSNEELTPFIPAAASLISDKKDWLYLACALKEGTDIWTSDKGFRGQRRVHVWTTEELAKKTGIL